MAAAPAPTRRHLRLLVPTVVTAVAVAVLVGLGAWQLERRAWKQELIETLEASAGAEPVDAAAAGDAAAADFRPAYAEGRLGEPTLRLIARTRGGRVGWEAVTPLALDDGRHLLVNRGWVPAERAPRDLPSPRGAVRVEGVLRLPTPPGRFTPDNDPARNEWYHPDPAAMAAAAGLDPGIVLPVVLVATGEARDGEYPAPAAVRIELTDNHLQYALTWLTLAAAVLAIYFLWVLRQWRTRQS